MMTDAIIQVDNIHKSYLMGKEAVPALRGVTINVQRGEVVCLMGPSGSGKTTLLNLLGGLDEPSRGHIVIDGANVVALKEEALARLRLQKLGYIFQTFNLLGNFTAFENVEAPMVLAGKYKRKERKKRVAMLLTQVGLADRMDHYPSELSGGQQQRVAIARALINHPTLLLADEPTGNLDSSSSQDVLNILAEFNEQGQTILMVTHDPLAAARAKRVLFIHDGCLVDSMPGGDAKQIAQRLAELR
jgi:putative ABC transport system ATP-binding protein